MSMIPSVSMLALTVLLLIAPTAASGDLRTDVEHGFVDNNGVKIHYASIGSGPLMVMLHGFPDFWYTWRNQMPVLAIFGLQDKALLPSGWNDTWEWIDNDVTLIAVPEGGHFIQHDAADFVTRSMVMWLNR